MYRAPEFDKSKSRDFFRKIEMIDIISKAFSYPVETLWISLSHDFNKYGKVARVELKMRIA